MRPTPLQRRLFLGVALAATIAAVFGQGRAPEEPSVVVAAVAPARATPAEPEARHLDIERLSRVPPGGGRTDLFAPKSWDPPRRAARAPPVAAPPAPVAPPLPFEYVGQMEGKDGLVAYLAREGDFLTVKAGDRLGAEYRVESIAPEALVLVYVPLEERQTLATVRREDTMQQEGQ